MRSSGPGNQELPNGVILLSETKVSHQPRFSGFIHDERMGQAYSSDSNLALFSHQGRRVGAHDACQAEPEARRRPRSFTARGASANLILIRKPGPGMYHGVQPSGRSKCQAFVYK